MQKNKPHKERTVTPIKSAPKYLVDAYKEREINAGANLLKKLLEDTRMLYGWPQITKVIEAKDGNKKHQEWWYHRVISSITYAKRKSSDLNTRLTRKEEKDKYLKIAENFEFLIERTTDSPLDVPAIELLDDEARSIFTAEELDAFSHVYSPELLQGMARLAQKFSKSAMTNPRPDERVEASGKKTPKHRPQERVFVGHLCKDFQTYFGSAMLGTTAKIANVVFDTNEEDQITKEFVRSAFSKMSLQET